MKKNLFYSMFAIMGMLLCIQSFSLEARHHHRSSHVQVGLGMGVAARESYVTRRYIRPAIQPVYVVPGRCYAPGYVYTAPSYAYPTHAYVEEIYVAPVSRPLTLGGLSFSWNFFK